ncbi:MAG: hypothetical protein ACOYOU_00810 [Kiritimatiellia bacterium]
MKRIAVIYLVLAMVPSLMATAFLQPSVYGDSRLGSLRLLTNETRCDIRASVQLPYGRHQGFTVCGWFRIKAYGGTANLTTFAFWCPEKIQYANPDLLAGVGGHGVPSGTNLTAVGGSIVVPFFPFTPYTNPDVSPISNQWSRGVYTLAGWASNALTVTLGGADIILGPGEFTRNAIPGPAASVILSGSGPVDVGISKTPCHRFFTELDGVISSNLMFSAASCISTEITFCVWRFQVSGSNQLYRSDIGRLAAFNETSQIRTNSLPPGGAFFDSGGYYTVGFQGFSAPPYDVDLFDTRVFPWCLSDAELERIHYNGVEEITRRGIPQWR